MIIANWIKVESPLYNRLNSFFTSLDAVFFLKPVLLITVWTMVTAGISAYEGKHVEDLYWNTQLTWFSFLIFTGVTLISCSSAVKTKNKESEKLILILLILGLFIMLPAIWVDSMTSGEISRFFSVGAWISLFYVTWRYYLNQQENLIAADFFMIVSLCALSAFSLFMAGWHIGGGSLVSGIFSGVPYVLGFVAVALFRPFVVKAETVNSREFIEGLLGVSIMSLMLLIVATTIGYMVGDPVISTAGAITVPFFLVATLFPRAEHIIRAFRYPILILAIFIGVRFPWLLVALFINFTFIRWYNYFRFGVVSPTLKVVND